jgi:tether containing UBX domain for GLUT4
MPPAEEEFKVYKPPVISTRQEDLPDDYFTPTVADLKERQAQLHARATSLNNAPLLTRTQREQQTKTKRDRWPNTTIRVRFLDLTQLEKTFPSSSKIRAVYAFVRESLREDVKPMKFILSSNPPPRDLKVSDPDVRDLTLAELGLAPSSVLLLRFVDDELNRSDLPAPLASAVLERAVELPTPPSFDGDRKKDGPSSVAASSKGKNSSGEVKIPKWLKLGPKK